MNVSKVVIVTGASKRFGKAIAIGLSRAGYTVVATGTNQDELRELEERLQGDYLTQVCDVTNPHSGSKLIKEVLDTYGHIDVLVNNAGIYMGESFVSADVDLIKKVFDVVVTGTATMSKLVLDKMSQAKSGQIINLIGDSAVHDLPAYDSSSPHSVDIAVKKAKHDVTELLRREAKESGVIVTSAFIHWIESDLDIDDDSLATKGATHPRDGVTAIQQVIELPQEKIELRPTA